MRPVRLDDSSLPGLRPTVGYLDARRLGIDGVVQAVVSKLTNAPPSLLGPTSLTGVPRTEAQRQQLLVSRQRGWEYLYFAAELLHDREIVEDHYRDHVLGFSARTNQVVTREAIWDFLSSATNDAQRIIARFMRLMESGAQERAFGAPGIAGDAELIQHLAHRWNDSYLEFMQWAARLRGANVPPEYSTAVELLARFSDDAIESYRRFVAELVRESDRIPLAISNDEPVEINMTLALSIPHEVSEAYSAELRRLSRRH